MENEQLEQELSSSSPPPSGTGNGNEDDAESVLDISEQINRPEDIPIQQQTINAWHPILDPNWMIFSYLILAAIMVPFGTYCSGTCICSICTCSIVNCVLYYRTHSMWYNIIKQPQATTTRRRWYRFYRFGLFFRLCSILLASHAAYRYGYNIY